MRVAERLLLKLSRSPNAGDRSDGINSWSGRDPLELLRAVYPDLVDRVRGTDVLDFGCGTGEQSIALAAIGAKSVLGVDMMSELLATARRAAGSIANVQFAESVPDGTTFDVIISQNSMEHFVDAESVLALWRRLLRPTGSVLVTFGPPWLAPYGAHMQFFTPVPWVHLLFSERTVMSARSRFRSDGAMRYEEVAGGLARMTLRKFERLVREAGFRIEMTRLQTLKDIPGTSIPLVRELITNHVTAILRAR